MQIASWFRGPRTVSILCHSNLFELALKRFCRLQEELWTSDQTWAAINFLKAYPIGSWHLDGTISPNQLQVYADLACTLVAKVYEVSSFTYLCCEHDETRYSNPTRTSSTGMICHPFSSSYAAVVATSEWRQFPTGSEWRQFPTGSSPESPPRSTWVSHIAAAPIGGSRLRITPQSAALYWSVQKKETWSRFTRIGRMLLR